jgi:hypothetical protein
VKSRDAHLRQHRFPALGNWFGERSLEADRFLPVDLQFLCLKSLAVHGARQSKTSESPTSTFFGSHPRGAHVPLNGLESTIATSHPAERHFNAAADAADPVPIAMRSNLLVMRWLLLGRSPMQSATSSRSRLAAGLSRSSFVSKLHIGRSLVNCGGSKFSETYSCTVFYALERGPESSHAARCRTIRNIFWRFRQRNIVQLRVNSYALRLLDRGTWYRAAD